MKNITLLLLIVLPFILVAQVELENAADQNNRSSQIEYFSTQKVKSHGIYLGLGGGFAKLNQFEFAQAHARLSYVANQRFEIGLQGEVLQDIKGINTSNEVVEFGAGSFGGIYLKGIYFGHKKIHLSTPLFLGAGAIGLVEANSADFYDCFDADLKAWTPMLIAEPGINVEFNINRVIGFEMGAKYRFATNSNFADNQLRDLNGFSAGATLKIGFFNFGNKQKESFPGHIEI